MKKYTAQEFLKAAEIGEVSMIDAKHIVSLLDEARNILSRLNCRRCSYSATDGYGGIYCFFKMFMAKIIVPTRVMIAAGLFII